MNKFHRHLCESRDLIVFCNKSLWIILLVLLLLPISGFPQWSSDPNNPIVIEEANAIIDPEVRVGDSMYYFTWAKSSSKGSQRYLAAYDFNGHPLWEVRDPYDSADPAAPGNSISWQNMWVDNGGSVLLAQLMKMRYGTKLYVNLAKINPVGETEWSTGKNFNLAGLESQRFHLVVNQYNEVFFAIKSFNQSERKTDLSLYKFGAEGDFHWFVERLFYEDSTVGLDNNISLLPDDLGGCFILYGIVNQVARENGYSFIDSELRLEYLNASGQKRWDRPQIVYEQNGKFFYPKGIMDEDGDIYAIWKSGSYLMQKIDPDGFGLWDTAGVEVLWQSWLREPLYFDFVNREKIKLVCAIHAQEYAKVVEQNISTGGELQHQRNGKILMNSQQGDWVGAARVNTCGDTTLVIFDCLNPDTTSEKPFQTIYNLFDVFGNPHLLSSPILYEREGGGHYLVDVTKGQNGQFIMVWENRPTRKMNMYAQNIFTDGAMGIRSASDNLTKLPINDPSFYYERTSRSLVFDTEFLGQPYSVYNLNGQQIAKGTVKAGANRMPLQSGLFLIRLRLKTGVYLSGKIIVD